MPHTPEQKRAHRAAHPEVDRAYRLAHRQERAEYDRAYRATHPDLQQRQRDYARTYYHERVAPDPEKRRVATERTREWQRANPDKRARWKDANRERINEQQRGYYAANPLRYIENARNWAAAHRDQVRQKVRLWQAANPEKVREYRHRIRAKRAQADTCKHLGCLSLGPVQLAWQTNPHRCWMCATSLDFRAKPGDPAHVHMDHVIPLARGGLHCAENLRPACEPCNVSKGAKLLPEVQ